jgi:chromosome segregation ATPase
MKTNKINILLIISAFALAVSCSNETKKEDVAVSERDYYAMVSEKNSAENNLYQTMNEIDNNLKVIRVSQGLLANAHSGSGVETFSKKEEILRTINDINSLLIQNQLKIEKLNDQLASLRSQKMRWKKESAEIAKFIGDKTAEMGELQEELNGQRNTIAALNQKVSDLQKANENANEAASENAERLGTQIQNINTELHKAYYALGSYKELKQHHVIEKKGGVLGVGSTEELKPDFEKAYFTEIDTRQITSIPVASKNPKLVTYHPVGSYGWEKTDGNMEYLTIKDPDKFWAASKYLVVEVK